MANKNEASYCEKIADAALLRLISRISVPMIGAICAWILTSNIEMQKTLSGLVEKVDGKVATLEAKLDGANNKIEGVDKRASILEDWRNTMDANAMGNAPTRHE